MIFDIFITLVALCVFVCIIHDIYYLREKKRKERFNKLAQRKIYIGSKEDLERLRDWEKQGN